MFSFNFLVIVALSLTIFKRFEAKSKSRKLRHHHDHRETTETTETTEKSRAMALCAGSKMLGDALGVIDQSRAVFGTTITTVITHCDELNENDLKLLQENNVTSFNLCNGVGLFGQSYQSTAKRLRSWWCKAAALILVPYDEVMVVDLDVIWFKRPDLLFTAKGYRDTGILFFRDRVYHDRQKKNKDDKIIQDLIEALIEKEAPFLNITNPDIALQKQRDHHRGHDESGMSFFFANILDRSTPAMVNHQDSSVMLVDRTRHPIFLSTLSRLLPDFNIGWGDKELYWVTAIIADEPFAFEPFLMGSYGDCGLMMHFDPTQADEDASQVTPFYINAEWLIEKIGFIGQMIEYVTNNPTKVSANMTLHNIAASRGCTCRFHGCRETPYEVNQYILRAQWERVRRGPYYHSLAGSSELILPTSTEEKQINFYKDQCIFIWRYAADQLSVMVNTFFILPEKCSTFGCPHVPIEFNENYDENNICLPIAFKFNPRPFKYLTTKSEYLGDNCSTILTVLPENNEGLKAESRDETLELERNILKTVTLELQKPIETRVYKEKELIRFSNDKQVYIVGADLQLHGIPNLNTFIQMGLDFSDVIVIDPSQKKVAPIGSMLPSV